MSASATIAKNAGNFPTATAISTKSPTGARSLQWICFPPAPAKPNPVGAGDIWQDFGMISESSLRNGRPTLPPGQTCTPPRSLGEKWSPARRGNPPTLSPWSAARRSHFHRAQQFTVQICAHKWRQLKPSHSLHCEDAFALLDHHQNDYHPETGLPPGVASDPNAFGL